ncbi:hypothetical protein ACFR99_13690 [Haloarchaeobius amylolyticus]|uniref:Uncharacterized protein n=1 Tax=Haloarchaeobius amylolyticus TaxID=1198296 RepID=A0ABD6BHR8_9EURY
MSPELQLFGSEEAPSQFVEDAGVIADFPESALNEVVPTVFDSDTGPMTEESEARSNVEMTLADHGIAPQDQDTFFGTV